MSVFAVLLHPTPPSTNSPLVRFRNLISGKKVGTAEVARTSQIVHSTGAEAEGYVRSNNGEPPNAFCSYAQIKLDMLSERSHKKTMTCYPKFCNSWDP